MRLNIPLYNFGMFKTIKMVYKGSKELEKIRQKVTKSDISANSLENNTDKTHIFATASYCKLGASFFMNHRKVYSQNPFNNI
jgi:hypothetical protein